MTGAPPGISDRGQSEHEPPDRSFGGFPAVLWHSGAGRSVKGGAQRHREATRPQGAPLRDRHDTEGQWTAGKPPDTPPTPSTRTPPPASRSPLPTPSPQAPAPDPARPTRPRARGPRAPPPPPPGARRSAGGVHRDGPGWGWAAGQLISTNSDVNRFHGALLGGRLLAPEQLAQMRTTVPAEYLGRGARYGLGLVSRPLSCDGVYWGHGGDIPGYETRGGATDDGRAVSVAVTVMAKDEAAAHRVEAVVDKGFCR
ncbi:serine hydrolase [Streptomyces sp. NPDC002209]|uniref:serine hydrolase n=1 Tax=Streptomyces sp. NPDC002209 TaxID=3364638 RepID=UPI0036C2490F